MSSFKAGDLVEAKEEARVPHEFKDSQEHTVFLISKALGPPPWKIKHVGLFSGHHYLDFGMEPDGFREIRFRQVKISTNQRNQRLLRKKKK
jgi:hypothetical protein